MTWGIVVLLAAGVWGQRFVGMFVGGRVLARVPALGRLATLIPAAVVMAVVVQLSVTSGRTIVVDARAAGIAVAAVAVWRRAPFVVVVLVAAAATGIVRAVGR